MGLVGRDFSGHFMTMTWKNCLILKAQPWLNFLLIIPILATMSIVIFYGIVVPIDQSILFSAKNVSHYPEEIMLENHKGLSSLNYQGHIVFGYAPICPALKDLMEIMKKLFRQEDCAHGAVELSLVGFLSASSLERFHEDNDTIIRNSLIFPNLTSNSTTLPKHLNVIMRPLNMERENGAVFFLKMLGQALIEYWSGSEPELHVFTQSFRGMEPWPLTEHFKLGNVRYYVTYLMIISIIAAMAAQLYRIAGEKESLVLRTLQCSGLNMNAYWWSTFLFTFLVFLPISLSCTYISLCYFAQTGDTSDFFRLQRVQHSLVLSLVFFQVLGLTGFTLVFAFVFHSAKMGVAIGVVFYFLELVNPVSVESKTFHAFSSPRNALSFKEQFIKLIDTAKELAMTSYDQQYAVGWYSLLEHKPELWEAFAALIGNAIVYCFLAWLVFKVVMDDTFFIQLRSKFWMYYMDDDRCRASVPTVREDCEGKQPVVQFQKVSKSSETGGSRLRDVTFDTYEGEITALIGLVNCGKNALLEVMCGGIPFTGSIMIHDMDYTTHLDEIRKYTGVCFSSRTAIYPMLTVEQNLWIFGQLKAFSQDLLTIGAHAMIDSLGLSHLSNTKMSALNSTAVRMFQIGMALLGENTLVFIASPMDELIGRSTKRLWKVLTECKKNCSIFVTTVHVGEAEWLGDRIVTFVDGQVRFVGSRSFIRRELESGYYLTAQSTSHESMDKVRQIVYQCVKKAKLTKVCGHLQVFRLPIEATCYFKKLLKMLRQLKDQVQVDITAMSLADAFLSMIGHGVQEVKRKSVGDPLHADGNEGLSITSVSRSSIVGHDIGDSSVDPINLFSPRNSTTSEELSDMDVKLGGSKTPCRGWQLIAHQMCAILKYKVILAGRVFYLYIAQAILLASVMVLHGSHINIPPDELGLHKEPVKKVCFSNQHKTCTYVRIKSIVPVTAGHSPSTTSRALVKLYADFLDKARLKHVKRLIWEPQSESLEKLVYCQFDKTQPCLIGALFEASDLPHSSVNATAYYGDAFQETEMLPLASTLSVMNTLIQHFTNSSEHVLNVMTTEILEDNKLFLYPLVSHYMYDFQWMVIIMFATVPYLVVKERPFKDILVKGKVHPLTYWLTTLLVDLYNYAGLCWLQLAMLFFLHDNVLVNNTGIFTGLLFFNGLCMLPFVYFVSSFFSGPVLAIVIFVALMYYGGSIVIFNQFYQEHIGRINDILFPFMLFPYSVSGLRQNDWIFGLCNDVYTQGLCQPGRTEMPLLRKYCCKEGCSTGKEAGCNNFSVDISELTASGVSMSVLVMGIHLFLWSCIHMLSEAARHFFMKFDVFTAIRKPTGKGELRSHPTDLLRKTKYPTSPPYDVPLKTEDGVSLPTRTASEVLSGWIKMIDISKEVEGAQVVKDLNLVIAPGEMVCLVGADHITTSAVLSLLADGDPTSGILLMSEYFEDKKMGYMSGEEPVMGSLTGREALSVQAWCHGILQPHRKSCVQAWIRLLGLERVADNLVSTYSRGRQRQLSIAMVLITDPELILLDKPFAHLDVRSKGHVWKCLTKMKEQNKTIVYTANDMEECATLVDRIAVFIQGRLVCLGTPQELTDRYCKSYHLMAKVAPSVGEAGIALLENTLMEKFPDGVKFRDHHDYVNLQVPYTEHTLEDLFGLMESTKKHLQVHDYLLSPTNLNHVLTAFNNILGVSEADKQNPPVADKHPVETESVIVRSYFVDDEENDTEIEW